MKALTKEERYERSYQRAGKFARILRRYSIIATATAVSQVMLYTANSLVTTDYNAIAAFLIGMPLGAYVGKSLEDYYEAASFDLEEYEGKDYKQTGRAREQKNTKLGFKYAFMFNYVTFVAGSFAIMVTANQIENYVTKVDTTYMQQLETAIKQNNRMIERDIKELDESSVKNFRDEVALSIKRDEERKTKQIEARYTPELQKALRDEASAKEKLKKWYEYEKTKAANKKDNYRYLNKVYREKLQKLHQPIDALKAKITKEMQAVKASAVTVAVVKEQYIAKRKAEIERLRKENEALIKKQRETANSLNTSTGLTSEQYIKYFVISLFLGAFFYRAQNVNYRYMKTTYDKLERERNASSVKVNEGFNLADFEIPETANNPEPEESGAADNDSSKDEEIIDYMMKVYSRTGELPNQKELYRALGVHPRNLANFYKRNNDLFIREHGKKVIPSEHFLYVLDQGDMVSAG